MNRNFSLYERHRFPTEIIQYAVWLYYRFSLSYRDIEDLLAQRGIIVRRESIRLWCNKFGPQYARQSWRRQQGYGDTFFIDEVFVKIEDKQHDLSRAVDRDGEAARRLFRRLINRYRGEPRKIVTDKLRSYGVAHRELVPEAAHDLSRYANNRAELSHQPTRVRERGMREFKSVRQAQRFLSSHSAVYNLFDLRRHLISVRHSRELRRGAFASWEEAVAA